MSVHAIDFDWSLVQADDLAQENIGVTSGVTQDKRLDIIWDCSSLEDLTHVAVELQRMSNKLIVYLLFTLITVMSSSFTKYWVIPFLIVLPVMLRYLSHVLTLYVVHNRVRSSGGTAD